MTPGRCLFDHDYPCGHGECERTGAWAVLDAGVGGRGTEGVGKPDWDQIDHEEVVRWTAADLDRCEHGRHSIDHCFDCPGEYSHGNELLRDPASFGHLELVRAHADGRVEVRIGTMVRGEPIWVVVRDRPREAEMTEQEAAEAEGKLPCSACGHRVRPGRHTEAECIRNQQNDRAETDEESQTDGN